MWWLQSTESFCQSVLNMEKESHHLCYWQPAAVVLPHPRLPLQGNRYLLVTAGHIPPLGKSNKGFQGLPRSRPGDQPGKGKLLTFWNAMGYSHAPCADTGRNTDSTGKQTWWNKIKYNLSEPGFSELSRALSHALGHWKCIPSTFTGKGGHAFATSWDLCPMKSWQLRQ